MTHQRNLMLEELEHRNYSPSTARAYLMTIKDFARYFRRSPDTLSPEHIRQYPADLLRELHLAANSVNPASRGAAFFLHQDAHEDHGVWTRLHTPRESHPATQNI